MKAQSDDHQLISFVTDRAFLRLESLHLPDIRTKSDDARIHQHKARLGQLDSEIYIAASALGKMFLSFTSYQAQVPPISLQPIKSTNRSTPEARPSICFAESSQHYGTRLMRSGMPCYSAWEA
jgi:hypothetical protein